MLNEQRTLCSRPPLLAGFLMAGLGCAACETATHDLDQPSSTSIMQGQVVRFTVAKDRLFWFEEYAERSPNGTSEHTGHRLVGCEKRDCKATRQQYTKQQPVTEEPSNAPEGWGDVSARKPSVPCMAVRDSTVYWTYGTAVEQDGELKGVAYTNDYVVVSPHETIWRLDTQQSALRPSPMFEFPVGWRCINVTLDDSAFYCAGKSGNILTHAIDSDPYPRVVVTDQIVGTSPSQLAVRGDYLYWARASGGIRRIRKDGTLPVENLDHMSGVVSLALDDEYLYWVDGSKGVVRRCVPANCATTMMTLATASADPKAEPARPLWIHSLQVLEANLYWLEGEEGQPSVLRRCPVDGCPSGAELACEDAMTHYAIDETGLYGVFTSQQLAADGSVQFEVRRGDLVTP